MTDPDVTVPDVTDPDVTVPDVTDADGSGVAVLVGSNRTGSINRTLAGMIADGLVGRGVAATVVELADFDLPLFDADLLARDGPPPAARELHDLIVAADGLVIVSPEYNGAMTPLLKNSIDWASRVDMALLLAKRVALAAASPGRRGAANALDVTSRWLPYVGADVHPETFGLPSFRHVVIDGELTDGHGERLDAFLDGLADWFRSPSAAPPD